MSSTYVRITYCSVLQMLLVDYYRAAPDLVQFNQYWCPDTTMMDKIKVKSSIILPPLVAAPR